MNASTQLPFSNIPSVHDFRVGDIVRIGSDARQGKPRFLAKVVSLGRKKLKVVQLEECHVDSPTGRTVYKVGSMWNSTPGYGSPEKVCKSDLPPHIVEALAELSERKDKKLDAMKEVLESFQPGDRVRFVGRGNEVKVGTVKKLNRKSVSVTCDDQHEDQWWNISPKLLQKCNVPAPPPPDIPASSHVMEKTRGTKITISFGYGRSHAFTAGGHDKYEVVDGMFTVNGRVRIADGTEYYAVLELSEIDGMEHNGTMLFVGNSLVDPHSKGSLALMGKKKEEVFPYKYKYDAMFDRYDHHVGPDGWSI